jgi:hypothetical protein
MLLNYTHAGLQHSNIVNANIFSSNKKRRSKMKKPIKYRTASVPSTTAMKPPKGANGGRGVGHGFSSLLLRPTRCAVVACALVCPSMWLWLLVGTGSGDAAAAVSILPARFFLPLLDGSNPARVRLHHTLFGSGIGPLDSG